MSARILVIDDDEAIRLLCRRALETGGYLVSSTGNPEEALALLDEEPVDLLIVDVLLAPLDLQFRSRHSVSRLDNGMQVVQAALAKRPDTRPSCLSPVTPAPSYCRRVWTAIGGPSSESHLAHRCFARKSPCACKRPMRKQGWGVIRENVLALPSVVQSNIAGTMWEMA